jgi:hypothetical protein
MEPCTQAACASDSTRTPASGETSAFVSTIRFRQPIHFCIRWIRSLRAGAVAWIIPQLEENPVRKFIFNGSIISAIFGGFSTIQATRKGPNDWRTILLWVSWIATLAVAIGTVVKQSNEVDLFDN